jgi:galactokinase
MISEFEKQFGPSKDLLSFRAPGRVNLIGEHTDYNAGFVFPCAIEMEVSAVAAPRHDNMIRAYSRDFGERKEFRTDDSRKDAASWVNYMKGVLVELGLKGGLTRGADIVFRSDLPVGSGLSSSAAFELINCLIFSEINGVALARPEMALLCQRAENKFVGVNCGIMDQFAIALGKKDHALFLDTRDLGCEAVPLNLGDYRIVIANTNKPRTLAGSAYNTRRGECETAVAVLKGKHAKIAALRDAEMDLLESCRSEMPDNVYRRAKHVIGEDDRVLASVKALKAGDLVSFGGLMIRSHESLRDLYEVSCKELDVMVEEALKVPGVLGSRMTGAGFGGCTVSLVKASSVDRFKSDVGRAYAARTGLKAEFYVTTAVDGVGRTS